MTISATARKQTFTGDGSSGQVFTVDFAAEKTDHVYVYEGDDLKQLTNDYTITGIGIPTGGGSNSFTVTWVGNTQGGVTYTVVRTSPRTQPGEVNTGFKSGSIEEAVNRLALQSQESIFATLEILDADGNRIRVLGTPIDNADAATLLYSQAVYSTSGFLPPPIQNVDEGKALYSVDTNTVAWRNPLDIPGSPGTDKVLRVQEDGTVDWEDDPTYTPTLPTLPSFLSTDKTDGSSIVWRVIDDLPPTGGVPYQHGITAQQGDRVAWEEVADIPNPPANNGGAEYILSIWTSSSITTTVQTIDLSDVTYLKKNVPDTNFGTSIIAVSSNSASNTSNLLIRQDISSLNIDTSQLVKAELSFKKKNGSNSSNSTTMDVARMKTAWTENGATWNDYDGVLPWEGGAGAENDIDTDKHIYPWVVRGKVLDPAGVYYDVEITELVRDAVDNRSGSLDLYAFHRNPTGAVVFSNWHSDDATAGNKPFLRVTTATSRQAKWLAVNWGTTTFDFGSGSSWVNNPHVGLSGWTSRQKHAVRYANHSINHNIGMDNLYCVAYPYSTDEGTGQTADGYDDGAFGVSCSTTKNTMNIKLHDWGRHFYDISVEATDHAVLVSYAVWSKDPAQFVGTEEIHCG